MKSYLICCLFAYLAAAEDEPAATTDVGAEPTPEVGAKPAEIPSFVEGECPNMAELPKPDGGIENIL